jgi:hypothetical protein
MGASTIDPNRLPERCYEDTRWPASRCLIARLPELVDFEAIATGPGAGASHSRFGSSLTIGALIKSGKLLEVHLRLVPACAPSLHRRRKPRPAEAHAAARGGKASRLQQVRCQE